MRTILTRLPRFYDEIDTIEKDKIVINAVSKKKELFIYPTIASLFLLLVAVFIENWWMRSVAQASRLLFFLMQAGRLR